MKICAENPVQPEFSVCGDAFDLDPSDTGADEFEPFRFARPGDTLTCQHCLRVIRELHISYVAATGKMKRWAR